MIFSEELISIIIPVYNSEKYIDNCLKSIINQDYKNIEIIIIDDGSKDDSFSICKENSLKDKRIKVFHQENSGVSAARNFGLNKVKGKYIFFADSDDFLEQNCISTLYKNLKADNSDYICGSYILEKTLHRSKKVCFQKKSYTKNDLTDNLPDVMQHIQNAPWGKLFRSDIIKNNDIRFPDDIPYGEDTCFQIEYFNYVNRVTIIPDIIYHYNFTNENAATKKFYPDIYLYFDRIVKLYERFFELNGTNNSVYKISELRNFYFDWCLRHYIEQCSNNENLQEYISKSAQVLLSDIDQCKYKDYIEKKEWNCIIKNWKKEHAKELISNKLKATIYKVLFK